MPSIGAAYPNIKTNYPMVIGCLDAETMALTHNAAVTEVALVTGELQFNLNTLAVELNQDSVKQYTLHFNLLDQIARDRLFDTDTYLFHMRVGGLQSIYDQVSVGLTCDEAETHNNLRLIQETVGQCAEIWVNGLSFDPGLLQSLGRSYGYTSGKNLNSLWDYSKERDTRTIYRTFPLVKDTKRSDHRALSDAMWCLDMATQYHQGVCRYLAYLANDPDKEVAA